MTADTKVQFVCFETTLDRESFMKRWKNYNRSIGSDANVILQQSRKDNLFLYTAKHCFENNDTQQFEFTKEGRSGRVIQERIKTIIIGGYAFLQLQKASSISNDESKILVYIDDVASDLALYNELADGGKLNIYQAYFQNCRFPYILEYFVKNKSAPELVEQLKLRNVPAVGIYKEFAHVKNTTREKERVNFIWPG